MAKYLKFLLMLRGYAKNKRIYGMIAWRLPSSLAIFQSYEAGWILRVHVLVLFLLVAGQITIALRREKAAPPETLWRYGSNSSNTSL